MSSRPLVLALSLTLAVACADRGNSSHDTTSRVVRGASAIAQAAPPTAEPVQQAPAQQGTPRRARNELSPAAQVMAERMVFVPRGRIWFVAAVRAKRLLVDIGRFDGPTPRDSGAQLHFRDAARQLSPLRTGTTLRLYGTWGTRIASVTGFDVWNGRIVASLQLPRDLDSLVRRDYQLPSAAVRVDTLQLAADSAARDSLRRDSAVVAGDSAARAAVAAIVCSKDTLPTLLNERVVIVRDSLERWLTDSMKAPYPRLEQNAKSQSFAVRGCFGAGRVLVVAARRNPSVEFSAERAVMLNDSGAVVRLRVADLRFRVHEPLGAFDADGDGIDDLAVRSLGERSGGLSILRFDTTAKRLVRLAAGFSWESP